MPPSHPPPDALITHILNLHQSLPPTSSSSPSEQPQVPKCLRLIHRIISNSNSTSISSSFDSTVRFGLRLLNANNPAADPDSQDSKDPKDSKGKGITFTFQTLTNNLQKSASSDMTRLLPAVLNVLLNLSSVSSSTSASNTGQPQLPVMAVALANLQNVSNVSFGKEVAENSQLESAFRNPPSTSTFTSIKSNAPPVNIFTNSARDRAIPEIVLNSNTQHAENQAGNGQSFSRSHMIQAKQKSEREYLRCCLFALQGISSPLISFTSNDESATTAVTPELTLKCKKTLKNETSTRHLLLSCAELGYLYLKLSTFLSVSGSGGGGGGGGEGTVMLEFKDALRTQVAEYFKMLTVLEGSISSTSSSSSSNSNSIGSSSGSGLTLRKLNVMLEGPRFNLIVLCGVCDALSSSSSSSSLLQSSSPSPPPSRTPSQSSNIKGGQILRKLKQHTHHGNPIHTTLLQTLLTRTSVSTYATLRAYILTGVLPPSSSSSSRSRADTDTEFFISEDRSVKLHESYLHRFRLVEGNVPPDISSALAGGIMRLGNGLYFARMCLGLKGYAVDYSPLLRRGQQGQQGQFRSTGRGRGSVEFAFLYGNEKSLAELVAFGNQQVQQLILGVILDRSYSLSHSHSHLRAIAPTPNNNNNNTNNSNARVAAGSLAKSQSQSQSRSLLKTHLHALKSFLFLGLGDFLTTLLPLLSPILSQPSNRIYVHDLIGVLDQSLKSTSACDVFDGEVLRCLNVRLLEGGGGAGEVGWDGFCLEYRIRSTAFDAPSASALAPASTATTNANGDNTNASSSSSSTNAVKTVITERCLQCYSRVFMMLFNLRRVGFRLSNGWRGGSEAVKLLRVKERTERERNKVSSTSTTTSTTTQQIQASLHQLSLKRQELLHVIQNLQSYVFSSVIESSYHTLVESMDDEKRVASLDDLVNVHETYLRAVCGGCFVECEDLFYDHEQAHTATSTANTNTNTNASNNSPFTFNSPEQQTPKELQASRNLSNQLQTLLSITSSFCAVQDRVYVDVVEYLQSDSSYGSRMRGEKVGPGKWYGDGGSDGGDDLSRIESERDSSFGSTSVSTSPQVKPNYNTNNSSNNSNNSNRPLGSLTLKSLEALEQTSFEFDLCFKGFMLMLEERVNGASLSMSSSSSPPASSLPSASSSFSPGGRGVKGGGSGGFTGGTKSGEDALRFLFFRLDFNGFYSSGGGDSRERGE